MLPTILHHKHEHIVHLSLARLVIHVPFKDKPSIACRSQAKDLRCHDNTWFIPFHTVQSKAARFHRPSTTGVAVESARASLIEHRYGSEQRGRRPKSASRVAARAGQPG